MDEQQTIESVIEQSEALVFEATEKRTRRDLQPIRDALSEYYDRINYLILHQDRPLGLPTGFRAIEQLLGGMQNSDLLVFAGRPGMGKTSFMLSVVLNVARFPMGTQKPRIALFTMEMGVEQVVQRLVSMETGINMQQLRLGQVSQQEQARLIEAMSRLSELDIFIDDTPALNPLELRAKCRRMHLESGIDLILVDYMQLMNAGGAYETTACRRSATSAAASRSWRASSTSPCSPPPSFRAPSSSARINARSCATCANPARLSRTPTSSCFCIATRSTTRRLKSPARRTSLWPSTATAPPALSPSISTRPSPRFRDVNAQRIDLGHN